MNPKKLTTIEDYILQYPPQIQQILQKLRSVIRAEAPHAEELISYGMPAFRQERILLYVGAFKTHIGLYPPIRGDEKLRQSLARYAGPKGNLKFPLDEPIPFELIRRVVQLRVKQEGKLVAKKK